MAALNSPYVPAQYNGQTYNVINFQCPHCGQQFFDASLKMAVFLYGVFFLDGKNAQYSGITCPKCLNSIIFNISGNLDNFFNSFYLFEMRNGKTLACDLRYYSSASSLAYQNCLLDGFDARLCPISLSDDSKDNFHEKLSDYTSENQFLDEKYLCSYVCNSLAPIGDLAFIFWCKENEIEKLISIENECKIKIFPRYYYDGSIHLNIEKFCWEQYLCEEFHEIEDMMYTIRSKMDFTGTSKFFEILLSDYNFSELPDPGIETLNMVNRIDTPFEGIGLNEDWSTIDLIKFKNSVSEKDRLRMVEELETLNNKNYVHQYLDDNYFKFIHEYIELSARSDFSYGSFRNLQMKYLTELYEFAHKESLNDAQYAFFPEGDTWTIIFEGKALRGLSNVGFKYIHHLLKFPDKPIDTINLNQTAFDPDLQQKEADLRSGEADFLRYSDNKSFSKTDDYEFNDKKTQALIKKTEKSLEDKLAALDPEKDKAEMNEINRQLAVINKEMVNKANNNNNRFPNEESIEIGTICQGIRRALLAILGEESDPYYTFRKKVYDHFYNSLKPIKSKTQQYRSTIGIKWALG